MENSSMVTDFICLGMTDNPRLGVLLLGVFLTMYIVTVLGNLGLVILIRVRPCLHTPTYFFLSNLSLLDVCFSSITIPKTLANLLSKLQAVSFLGCITQMGLFIIFASAECNVLASMAHYTAICHPLLYHATKSRVRCPLMVAGCYFRGLVNMISVTTSITQLSFFQPRVLPHFFCDIPPPLALACSDPWVTQILVIGCGGFTLVTSLVVILVSYVFVLMMILEIPSASGKQKAFSMCASHMTAVGLHCGATMMLLAALSTWIPGGKSDGFSVLYNGDPHVKSSFLQFEKPGSESCFMENIESESPTFHSVSQEYNMFYEDLLTVLFTVFSLPANEALLRTSGLLWLSV